MSHPGRTIAWLGLAGALAACGPVAGASSPGSAGTSQASADETRIKAVIQRAATAQASAVAQQTPALMAPTATEAYYQQLVRTNESLLSDGVRALELVALDWGPIALNGSSAEATTFETWRTDYGADAVDEARDRNRYVLVPENGAWKIRSSLRPDSGLFQPAAEAASSVSAPAVGVGGARSHNWSGYAAEGEAFTGVMASWTVPRAASHGGFAADSTWIGIGGLHSNDLIQAGTEQRLLPSGKAVYDAWLEMLPQPSQIVPLNVSGGDSISTSIEQQPDYSWRISIKDNTTGRTYQSDQQYQSGRSSAEWIEESPTGRRGGVMPLDDFRSVTLTAASAIQDGRPLRLGETGAGGITMSDRAGNTLAQPSQVGADRASFTVVRLNAPK